MAKSLVLGNGSMLACFDKSGQLSDLFFPHVGLENHVGEGLSHRVGIFVENQFAWLNDPAWQVSIEYLPNTFASHIVLIHPRLAVRLVFNDVVYNEHNILIRKITLTNTADRPRSLSLFCNNQFHISESSRGDTAYFEPKENALVHYKGKRVIYISAKSANGEFFKNYSIGLLGIEGKEGTWRDAEDGMLSQNGVEHGSVDSVLELSFILAPQESATSFQWIAAGTNDTEAREMHRDIIVRTPEHLFETTVDYWNAWIEKRPRNFYDLDEEVVQLFKKSLLVIRAHYDTDGGIIASSDSDILQYGRDTYAYVWPRDAAYTALALDRAGYDDISERFFVFCANALTKDGYLLHKYRPDGSLGSSWHPWVVNGVSRLPIQEDETAIVLYALWEHYLISKNLEFIEKMYNPLIKAAADFLVTHRNLETSLPKPSYDLWEERWGVSCYSAAATVGGLRAAAQFARLLGKEDDVELYDETATSMQKAVLKYFYLPEEKYFAKMCHFGTDPKHPNQVIQEKTVDASSAYGILRFQLLPANDERVIHAFAIAESSLSPKGDIGGIARYEGDKYYRVTENAPGNPWFIPTFWHIEYHIAKATTKADLAPIKERLKWAGEFAVGAGMLSEQINPETGAPLSVCPLTWSHAAYVLAVVAYIEKFETL